MTRNTPALPPARNATASPLRRAKTKKATNHERGFACGVAVDVALSEEVESLKRQLQE
jgi:hypothetical protein